MKIQEFIRPTTFCERHQRKYFSDECVDRCAHLGNRFVDWSEYFCFVDYTEDLPDGGVVVEHYYCDTQEKRQRMWSKMISKMKKGIPPDPEV